MRVLLVALVSCLSLASGVAQEAAPLKYDVATVKENKSASGMTMLRFTGSDMLNVENGTLQIMLSAAYGLHPYLIEGVPKWGENQHFDVQAKILDATPDQIKALTIEQRRAMFAAVLVDRFHLKTHWETREKPEYELVLAKGGSKMKEGSGQQHSRMLSPNTLNAKQQSAAELAEAFADALQEPVVDRTGLMGKYDVDLKWAPMTSKSGPDAAQDEDAAPDIFTAVKETLGLELKPSRGPVQVLVVDGAEMPVTD
ncbi:TIGR03435 family protein [Silvibacterium dinghuense]|uniref:TIGR03435 family protein n=1 Tax=Silvibacterium dinghuense TaxID=1560006 RepID=A0A4Q1S9L8_9BACT|nr:TIGR03435 family protein [Silvibacterium dinghuense]RXS93756.1 TIGR03435 family protein [Silvibacterium dinghuense]GGH07352.1 hypothetical protein GCM10011586_24580 [Silvibacterium dinghuense]